jgi:DNA polymerase
VLRDRGTVLERDSTVGPGAFVVTVHPSSILRTPPEDRDAAYAGLVADLRVAAAVVS